MTNTPINAPKDEYAHLAWEEHPDNPANYPEIADLPQKPLNDDEISWKEAYLTGAEMMTQSEFEALTKTEDTD